MDFLILVLLSIALHLSNPTIATSPPIVVDLGYALQQGTPSVNEPSSFYSQAYPM